MRATAVLDNADTTTNLCNQFRRVIRPVIHPSYSSGDYSSELFIRQLFVQLFVQSVEGRTHNPDWTSSRTYNKAITARNHLSSSNSDTPFI